MRLLSPHVPALLLTLVLLLLHAPIPVARAGPQVPEVPPAALPVAGTCAPLPQTHVTWVTIGELDW